MLANIWDQRVTTARERKQAYEARIVAIEKQVEALLDRLIESDTPSVIAAYERKVAELEQEKLILAEKAESTDQPTATFEQMFELANAFLSTPWILWESGKFELQRLVLKLAFAERLPYCRKSGFRTPEFSLPFKTLKNVCTVESDMAVGPVLSEPVSTRISLFTGNLQGNLEDSGGFWRIRLRIPMKKQWLGGNFPTPVNREIKSRNREKYFKNREQKQPSREGEFLPHN